MDSEDDIKKKNIDKKKELAKALKYFEGQKRKYKVPVESMGTKVSDEDQQMLKAYQEQMEKSKEAQSLAQKRAPHIHDPSVFFLVIFQVKLFLTKAFVYTYTEGSLLS